MVRAPKEKAKRMHEYVLTRLSDSGIYVARQVAPDQYQLERTNVGRVQLFLHTESEGAEKFSHRIKRLIYEGNNVANVFYKESDSNLPGVFFQYMSDEEVGKKMNTTLKEYAFPEIKSMVKFRDKECDVLGLQGIPILTYYRQDNHAQGGRTSEGLASFEFLHPRKNYTHIEEDRLGRDMIMKSDATPFASLGISKSRVSLEECIRLVPSRKNSHVFYLGEETDLRETPERVEKTLRDEHFRQTRTREEDWGQEGVDGYLNPQ